MKRRQFLNDTSKAVGLLCCIPAVLSIDSCVSMSRISFEQTEKELIVLKSDISGMSSVVLDNNKLAFPVLLEKGEKGVSALLMCCTHKQCSLKKTGQLLLCPCHRSEFDIQGKVLKGPAIKDLQKLVVKEDELRIYIYLKQG